MTPMKVAQISQDEPQAVEIICRVCQSKMKISQDDCKYHVLTLVDYTGKIKALVWPEKYRGQFYPGDNEIVLIKGKFRIYQNTFKAVDVYEIQPVPCTAVNPIELVPYGKQINQADVQELIQVINGITSPSLKCFLFQIFADDTLTRAFLTGKASLKHHHAEAGGLLRHSLECARIINRMTELPTAEREIGVVSALLHDIAKTQEHYNRPGCSAPMISHDARTLEILAAPLRTLEEHWPDGAGLVRMALTFPLVKKDYYYQKKHVPSVVDLVWQADQVSCSFYMETGAFADTPDWKRYQKWNDLTYWRPAADNYRHNDVSYA